MDKRSFWCWVQLLKNNSCMLHELYTSVLHMCEEWKLTKECDTVSLLSLLLLVFRPEIWWKRFNLDYFSPYKYAHSDTGFSKWRIFRFGFPLIGQNYELCKLLIQGQKAFILKRVTLLASRVGVWAWNLMGEFLLCFSCLKDCDFSKEENETFLPLHILNLYASWVLLCKNGTFYQIFGFWCRHHT